MYIDQPSLSIIEEHIKIFVPILEEAWIGALKEKYYVEAIKDVPPSRTTKGREPVKKELAKKKVEAKAPKAKIDLKSIKKGAEVPSEETKEALIKTEKGIKLTKEQLSSLFDSVEKQIEQKTGSEISELLKNLKDAIELSKGQSGVLIQIKNAAFDLSDKSDKFNISERYEIKKKVTFWRKKLNL